MPGPIPKRDEERRRANMPAAGPAEQAEPGDEVYWPKEGRDWHPVAKGMYHAIKKSGVAKYYEGTDKYAAWSMCNILSEVHTMPPRGKAMLLAQLNQMQTDLLITEGSRRRARLELVKKQSDEEAQRRANIANLLEAARKEAAN